MKIKIEYLDTKVNCPISGSDVILRYVSESLYNIYSKAYPDAFEEDKKVVEKNVDTITNTK
jgi:hypothetical protein